MATDENKAVLQRAVEHFSKGDRAGYLELYHPNVVLRGYPPGLAPGKEGAVPFYN